MKWLATRALLVVGLLFGGFFMFIFMLVAGREAWDYLIPEEEKAFSL